MASNIINLFTNEQLSTLKELYEMLINVHLDKSKLYQMTTVNATGKHKNLVNREEYLEFILSVTIEELGEIFPQLGEYC